jgi:hypothetical protein
MSKKVSQPWFLLGNGKLVSQKRKSKKKEGKLGFSQFFFFHFYFFFSNSLLVCLLFTEKMNFFKRNLLAKKYYQL